MPPEQPIVETTIDGETVAVFNYVHLSRFVVVHGNRGIDTEQSDVRVSNTRRPEYVTRAAADHAKETIGIDLEQRDGITVLDPEQYE